AALEAVTASAPALGEVSPATALPAVPAAPTRRGTPSQPHLARLRPAVTRHDLVVHAVALVQLGEPTRQRAHVHEDVVATRDRRDEAEALLGVEPGHRSVRTVRGSRTRARPSGVGPQRDEVVRLRALLA